MLIVGSRGNACSGRLAPDLVLTAAHCVLPGADYKIVEFESRQPQLRDVVSVTAHPKFDLKTMLAHRATADVALIKLAAPLRDVEPATLGPAMAVAPGDAFTVAGTGVSVRGDGKTGGTIGRQQIATAGRGTCRSPCEPHARRKPGMGAATATQASVFAQCRRA